MEIELQKKQIDEVFELQKNYSIILRTSTAEEGIEHIRRLHDWILAHRQDIRDALYADYRKPNIETDIVEMYPAVSEARHTMKSLKRMDETETGSYTCYFLRHQCSHPI